MTEGFYIDRNAPCSVYEVLEHTADVGIRGAGPTLEEAFRETARGMFSIIGTASELPCSMEVAVTADGHDHESLLHGLLSELLFVHEVSEIFVTDLELVLDGLSLKGTARGCPASLSEISSEIKAVTYHRLSVAETAEGWVCEVLFDI